MSGPGQHILTWSCGDDEDKEIRGAVQTKYNKGKIKYQYQIPNGVQFQARLKVVSSFLLALSRQHPEVEFTQEWASASRTEGGTSVFLAGGWRNSILPVNPNDNRVYACDIWERAAHTEALSCFREKIESAWQAYREKLHTLSKNALIDRAEEIAAVKLCRDVLTSHSLTQNDLDYLNRFADPLQLVAESWLSEQDGDQSAALDHVLWTLRDRQDAEQDYELDQTM